MYIRFTYKSSSLARATDVHVFLPFHDGYPSANAPYPTLYFLSGYSANAEEIAFTLPMRQMCSQYGVAIVIVNGENSFYSDHPQRAAFYADFAGREVVEATRHTFPCLSTQRKDTFIGGISMGGYGAVKLGLRFKDTFSKIAMMSPAVEADLLLELSANTEGAVPGRLFEAIWGGHAGYDATWHNPLFAVQEYLQHKEVLPPMYMCCGRQDALVLPACEHFYSFLQERGVPITYRGGEGGHDLMYWDRHLDELFSFLKEE